MRAALVALVALAGSGAARADEARLGRCLTRLVTVAGLASDDGLTIGGDGAVVIVRGGDPARFYAFSGLGFFAAEGPWPRDGAVSFAVRTAAAPPSSLTWRLRGGRVASQDGRDPARGPDVIIDRWWPLDAQARAVALRVIETQLPKVASGLEVQRAFAAQRHLPPSEPRGWAQVYALCRGIDARIEGLVTAEEARWKRLVAMPLPEVPHDVVRRVEHPEWFRCARDRDCVVERGPCGWPDAVARAARPAYAAWSQQRGEQVNCDAPDGDARVAPACRAGRCVDPAATPQPRWSACAVDTDCVVDLACDTPIAINRQTRDDAGYARWRWLRVVDGWDACAASTDTPAPGRCAAGRCVPR